MIFMSSPALSNLSFDLFSSEEAEQGQSSILEGEQGNPWQTPHRRDEIPASVKWIQGWALQQGSKFSSGEQPQLQPNPIFRPLSEGQALQHSPAQPLLKTLSGLNITSWEFHQAKALTELGRSLWATALQMGDESKLNFLQAKNTIVV